MRPLALPLLLLAAAASAQSPLRMEADGPPPAGPTLAVHVRADGVALVDGSVADSAAVAGAVRKHARAHPDGATAFSTSRGTPFAVYVRVLDTVKAAYTAERDAYAVRVFGAPYAALDEAGRRAVAKAVPLRISLEEPR